jgi:hypothetical protein
VIIFLLQFLFEPTIERNKTAESSVWIQKKEALIKAADLVSELYQTLSFLPNDTSNSAFAKYDEVNSVYFKLLIFCEDEKIASKFWRFFDSKTPKFTPVERAEFFSLLKYELIGKKLVTPTDSIPIFKSLKN